LEKDLNIQLHEEREGKYKRCSMESENFGNEQFDAIRIVPEIIQIGG
jgi:hypothetical protein